MLSSDFSYRSVFTVRCVLVNDNKKNHFHFICAQRALMSGVITLEIGSFKPTLFEPLLKIPPVAAVFVCVVFSFSF